jgi:hypothetical protein
MSGLAGLAYLTENYTDDEEEDVKVKQGFRLAILNPRVSTDRLLSFKVCIFATRYKNLFNFYLFKLQEDVEDSDRR